MREEQRITASLKLLTDKESACQLWNLCGKNTFTLGRITSNDITLPYSWVSRKHAMIQAQEDGRLNLIDLGSSNGTFVNGKRIYTPCPLQNNDQIGIGSTRLIFQQETPQGQPLQRSPLDLDEMTIAFVRKEIITVLICDIHDYTRLSEVIGVQRISQLLQHWTGRVGKLVNKYDGVVDKFIGDAVMAIWTGSDIRDNINRALKTAMAINIFTSGLGKELPDLPWTLHTGAAINSGEAMLGNVGQSGRQNYTVVGDMVNVAFRLEGMTSKQSGIDLVMGSDAAIHLPNKEGYFQKQSFALKGKQEPVEAYACTYEELREYLKKTSE